jgi:hypothetical protein
VVCRYRKLCARPYLLIPFCAVFLGFVILDDTGLAAPARPAAPEFSGMDLYRGIILAHGPVAGLIPEIRDQLVPPGLLQDRQLRRAMEMFQDRLIEEIALTHPRFFDEFAAAMRSGDHLAVQDGLEKAARVTLDTLSGMHEVAALRAALKEDPGRMRGFLDALKQNPEAAGIDDATIQKAIELAIARGLEQDEAPQDPYTVDSSVVVVLVAVAAIVAAITVVLAQSYAAALNIATAVNVAVVVVAWTYAYAAWGGGGDPRRMKAISRLPLDREQMVDSIVLAFGS